MGQTIVYDYVDTHFNYEIKFICKSTNTFSVYEKPPDESVPVTVTSNIMKPPPVLVNQATNLKTVFEFASIRSSNGNIAVQTNQSLIMSYCLKRFLLALT